MSIVHHRAIPLQPFPGGATYQMLVGVEILTILSGTGEAWIEGQEGVSTLEDEPLVTYGVHASPNRIVDIHEA
jgi:hypothetical protein